MLVDSIEMIEGIWASEPPYDLTGQLLEDADQRHLQSGAGFGWLPKPYRSRAADRDPVVDGGLRPR